MLEVVTVKFEASRPNSDFVSPTIHLRIGDRCIVSTDRGVELGLVLRTSSAEKFDLSESKFYKVLRKATERDLYLYEKKKDREVSTYQLCKKLIKVQDLPMKLSEVEHIFDGSRVICYFTANQRVDFRNLVKKLSRQLRTRIEMRQIGARDEAKLIGGQGCCGLGENCSAKFLKELKSVAVRAAKEQGLSVNPNRLSGMCGRLKCCLNYELGSCENGACGST